MDDRTRKFKTVIKGGAIITRTGHFNVYNTTHDIYQEMRSMRFFIGSLVAASALLAAPASADEALAKKHNCLACHQLDKKVIGPSYKDVAKKYKGQNAAAQLEQKVKKGSSGVWGAIPMPPNAAVPDADVKKLVDWILKLG